MSTFHLQLQCKGWKCPPQNILPSINGIIGIIIYLGIKNISLKFYTVGKIGFIIQLGIICEWHNWYNHLPWHDYCYLLENSFFIQARSLKMPFPVMTLDMLFRIRVPDQLVHTNQRIGKQPTNYVYVLMSIIMGL